MTLTGIDVSQHQDHTPALGGLAFLIARASIGLVADTMYDTHIANARASGLVVGAYHFNWDTTTPEAQAQFFVAQAGNVPLLFLDVEGAHAFTPDEAQRFIAEVHRLGRTCGLYMSASAYHWGLGQDYDWVAKWADTQPAAGWEFWQYADKAPDGSAIDYDKFNGSLADLSALTKGAQGMSVYEKQPLTGHLRVTTGKVAHGLAITDAGFTATGVNLSIGSAEFDHVMHRLSGTGPSYAMHVPATSTSLMRGQYISSAEIDETYDPVLAVLTFADLVAARQEQWDLDSANITIAATAKLKNVRPS